MKVQSDYETEQILAVFRTPGDAQTAMQRLAEGHIHADEARHSALPPGRYDKADGSLGEGMAAVVRGAEIGAPAGAVLGLGAAAALLGGSSVAVMAGLAAGGAFVGGVLGALEGAVLRAHFDDDAASVYEVRDGTPAELLILQTAACDGSTARARRLLASAGALAFLDTTTLQLP